MHGVLSLSVSRTPDFDLVLAIFSLADGTVSTSSCSFVRFPDFVAPLTKDYSSAHLYGDVVIISAWPTLRFLRDWLEILVFRQWNDISKRFMAFCSLMVTADRLSYIDWSRIMSVIQPQRHTAHGTPSGQMVGCLHDGSHWGGSVSYSCCFAVCLVQYSHHLFVNSSSRMCH